jgi:beta-N-acetylhexosaminidase
MSTQLNKTLVSHLSVLPQHQRAGVFVWPSLAGPELNPEEEALLFRYKPSGIVLFRRSMKSLAQTRALCERVRALTSAPHQPRGAVIAIDEEGGRVYRMPAPFPRLEPAAAFADVQREPELRSQVMLQAHVARALGIDCLFAPVADVLTRPDNPAIGDRAFSDNPETVARCAGVVLEEIQRAGLLGCAKHFPGHGHTASDSHKGFATSDVALKVMREREWIPFRRLIQNSNIPLIMTAHVICESLDPGKPATLSKDILQTYLRDELGFGGIIVSDDLRMNAISDYYGVSKKVTAAIVDEGQNPVDVSDDRYLALASRDALSAGCDVLLSCQSIVREEVVLRAIENDLLPVMDEQWFIDKANRILTCLAQR